MIPVQVSVSGGWGQEGGQEAIMTTSKGGVRHSPGKSCVNSVTWGGPIVWKKSPDCPSVLRPLGVARWHVKMRHPGKELIVKCRWCGYLPQLIQEMVEHRGFCVTSPCQSKRACATARGQCAVGDPLVTPVQGGCSVATSSPTMAGAIDFEQPSSTGGHGEANGQTGPSNGGRFEEN